MTIAARDRRDKPASYVTDASTPYAMVTAHSPPFPFEHGSGAASAARALSVGTGGDDSGSNPVSATSASSATTDNTVHSAFAAAENTPSADISANMSGVLVAASADSPQVTAAAHHSTPKTTPRKDDAHAVPTVPVAAGTIGSGPSGPGAAAIVPNVPIRGSAAGSNAGSAAISGPMSPPPNLPTVIRATYSGVDVLELDVDGIAVMRRAQDSALNATQILKVAGVDKFRRTKILEKEEQSGCERVQGGYGKYQGTWIPFEQGVRLCRQYGVMQVLEPLLRHDMSSSAIMRTPTKEQALGAKRKRTQESPSWTATQRPAPPLFDEAVELVAQPLSPVDESAPNFDRSRDIITELFLNSNDNVNLDDVLSAHRDVPQIEIDVPIDDSGHTALHWAATLGRVQLVRDLIRHGADPRRGNYSGETPLVRAALVTNNSDLSTFTDLLDEMYPALYITDNSGRTLLHHIALTAGIKGRSDASRYYLECLLEWVVRRGSSSSTGKFGLNTFISTIVNFEDHNGDTALNIAARIGNKNIARQLMEVGADTHIANRAGLRPADFGIDAASTITTHSDPPLNSSHGQPAKKIHLSSSNSSKSEQRPANGTGTGAEGATKPSSLNDAARSGLRPLSAAEKRHEVIDLMFESIRGLDSEFDREAAAKQQLLTKVHEQLRDATSTLNMYKRHGDQLRQVSTHVDSLQRSAKSLLSAIESEDKKFKDEEQRQGRNAMYDYDASFDADEPFRLDTSSEELRLGHIPPVLLEARIAAYRKNQEMLETFRDALRGRSIQLEAKFRKVVSLCTGVPEAQVEGVLEGLVQAVESDSGEADMGRITGFLRKIET